MFRITMTILVLIKMSSLAFAQQHPSPYADERERKIKALSTEEMAGYLSGHGMGFAKAAELNHYPGPKHVLELAPQLNLPAEQFSKTKAIHDEMLNHAVPLGKQYVKKEAELDSLFSHQKIAEALLQSLVSEISAIKGQLRLVHLNAHLEMKRLLTPEQIAKYDELRGYKKSDHHFQH